MAQLTIRKLDDDLVRLLKLRAVQNNRSAEAEVRVILQRALADDETDQVREGQNIGDSAEIIRQQRDERTRHLERLTRSGRR